MTIAERQPGVVAAPETTAPPAPAAAPSSGTAAARWRAARRLKPILCLDDFEPAARRFLPRSIFGYIAGGVETDWSLRANREAFARYAFVPRMLVDTSRRTTAHALFGHTFDAPFGIAPMGASGLAGFHADLVYARATAAANIPFLLSGASIVTLERVAQANPATWFQAYLPPDRNEIAGLMHRVADAGYENLVVTVDVPIGGNRENNVRNGYSSPLRPTLKLTLDAISHPRWLVETVARTLIAEGMPHFENGRAVRGVPVFSANAERSLTRDSLDWRDIEWMRARWRGRLLIKGILAAADARKAREIGIDGIFVSNHGGRQLDGAVSPLQVLAEVARDARPMAVIYDGGIRRGTDVIKALALGADFVFIGRPFLYAATIAEQEGVAHAIALLKEEIKRDLALLGRTNLSDLAELVVPAV
jgi:L-lactate dehydrogenase (cytochrome)